MKIIGIAGKARSGKDTLAKMLIHHASEGIHMSFAAPIREFVAGLLNVALDALDDGAYKEAPLPELSGKSPREMMQTLGTEWGRDRIDPDLWIKVAKWKLDALERSMFPPKVVVFSDVRFENEAEMIRSLGGIIVHLTRDGTPSILHHKSERGISQLPGDVQVDNSASLGELRERAGEIIASQCESL